MVEAGRSVPRRVGIKDVARAAGVSITTVSHVLSDRRPVSRETRERVLAAIEELGYRPNAAAQSLITRRTNTIGLVIPDITNPFYPALAKGMLDVLDPAGYSLMIFSTDGDPEAEARVIDRMLGHGVDGLAFAGYQGYAGQLEKVVERGSLPSRSGSPRSYRASTSSVSTTVAAVGRRPSSFSARAVPRSPSSPARSRASARTACWGTRTRSPLRRWRSASCTWT
ncbi:hypothetical protein GCM10025864_14310 [Luteimicrobium album]|uniref:HTH lacI-type domain-containing protein n=1 Tax=Luteimicrobium album TaxID=1054550 RepID=A0ABQ6I0A2_9MICO|nr:LacI family DNA-binding transcriptional regulator [Luteimicrobium album]GMA23672.1 hypothetical protein GCM10025864_14310 [Luteimicrobium album]